MPLPSSGPLSISAIRNELVGTYGSSYSLRQLSSWAGFSTPDSISEFYGYSANVTLYFDFAVPNSATCWSSYTFAAATSTTVNTNVSVTIYWYGDLGGFMSGTVTIFSGTACNTVGVNSGGGISCWGENASIITIPAGGITPTSSGNQTYLPGNQLAFYPC